MPDLSNLFRELPYISQRISPTYLEVTQSQKTIISSHPLVSQLPRAPTIQPKTLPQDILTTEVMV